MSAAAKRVALARSEPHHSSSHYSSSKGDSMHKQSVLNVVQDRTNQAALEARTHNLFAAGDAFEVLGQTTVAIGHKVRGWEQAFGTAVGPILHHHRKATPAQLSALAKARRARKITAHGRLTTKKAAHHGHRKHRSPAQEAATRKLVRLNKARARARHGTHHKHAKKHARHN